MISETDSTRDSLGRFGTITFGRVYMRSLIRIDRIVAGRVDASMWWGLVPECYRPAVEPLVQPTFDEHRGRKLTADELDAFVDALHDRIWRQVEPIRPGSLADI